MLCPFSLVRRQDIDAAGAPVLSQGTVPSESVKAPNAGRPGPVRWKWKAVEFDDGVAFSYSDHHRRGLEFTSRILGAIVFPIGDLGRLGPDIREFCERGLVAAVRGDH